MNLAQLIDPEWVQKGRPERFPVRRPAAPDLAVRTRAHDLDHAEVARPAHSAAPAIDEAVPERLIVNRRPGSQPLRGLTRTILELLAAASVPLSASAVRNLLGEAAPKNQNSVGALIASLVERKLAEKECAKPGPYTYRVTELGRARLR